MIQLVSHVTTRFWSLIPNKKKGKKEKEKKTNMNWDLNVLQQLLKTFLTCLGWSRRGVGAVGAVCSIRGVET